MAKEYERLVGIFFFGDQRQFHHVLYQQVESAFAEIAEVLGRARGASVAPMIVRVYHEARLMKDQNEFRIAPDVFAKSVRDLDDAAGGTTARPTGACELQAVLARESKYVARILR